MITTVCLNPAIDKTAAIAQLVPGEVHRLERVRCDLGGKGLNVARALQRLGVEASCVGCLGEEGESGFLFLLAQEGLRFPHISLPGNLRSNLKIVDEKNRQVTEFNEPGPAMDAARWEEFLSLLQKEARGSAYVALSGSLPAGCGPSAYQQCMQALPEHSFLLDAAGEALLLGLQEKPFLIKPNLQELQEVTGRELRTLRAIRDAAWSLVKRGARHVLVSMGSCGALLTDGARTVFSPALQVERGSTVGAGDAMLAGVLMGLCQGGDAFDALRYGMAAGAASVMTRGTEPPRPEDFHALLPKVTRQEV